MNGFEMLYLYFLNIPLILFYSLPVSFFVAASINIAKLSSEYELIVINSFGLSPLKIMKSLIPISLLMSILLIIISFVLIPKGYYSKNIFINKKKQEARFNIKPSEYGQKFGPWYMYVESKEKNNIYKNIILYQNDANSNTFISAKKAIIINNGNSLSLELYNGTSSIVKNDLNIIEFTKMIINNELPQPIKITSLKDIINYWVHNPRVDDILFFYFISIMPIISILLFVAIGYYNPRYQKNNSTFYSMFFLISYIVIMQKLSKTEDFNTMIYFPIFWILLSIAVYFIRVKKYF
jgi:lipopolysaccharide export system permease protein